jgi:putative transposase
MARKKKPHDPFRWFDSSPEVIRLVVMMYVRYPLSLRNVEDLLFERGIDICHETVWLWWNRFGPMFASEIRRKRVQHKRSYTHWRWHLDEVFVRINGKQKYLWRAVNQEGDVLESYVTEPRDKAAALKFIKKAMRRHGRTKVIVTDRPRSYGAALKEIGSGGLQQTGRRLNNRAENSHLPFRHERRTKGPFLGPLTGAIVGLAVIGFVMEEVSQVKGPRKVEFHKESAGLIQRGVGVTPPVRVRSPEGAACDPPRDLCVIPRLRPQGRVRVSRWAKPRQRGAPSCV